MIPLLLPILFVLCILFSFFCECSLRWFLRKMRAVPSEPHLLQLVTTLCSKPSTKQGMIIKQEEFVPIKCRHSQQIAVRFSTCITCFTSIFIGCAVSFKMFFCVLVLFISCLISVQGQASQQRWIGTRVLWFLSPDHSQHHSEHAQCSALYEVQAYRV